MHPSAGYPAVPTPFSSQPMNVAELHRRLFQSHNAPRDYEAYPEFSEMFPEDQCRSSVHKPHSSIITIDSSSSGIESIDDDSSFDTRSSRSNSSLSSSTSSYRPAFSHHYQSRHRKRLQKHRYTPFFHEKQLLLKNKSLLLSSKWTQRRPLSSSSEGPQDHLQRLYDEYSREDVRPDWTPLTTSVSRQLCQYAFDKYNGRLPSN